MGNKNPKFSLVNSTENSVYQTGKFFISKFNTQNKKLISISTILVTGGAGYIGSQYFKEKYSDKNY